jgi:3-dehydroquinate synthase class II
LGSKAFKLEKVDTLRIEETSVCVDDLTVCLVGEGMFVGSTVDLTEGSQAVLLRWWLVEDFRVVGRTSRMNDQNWKALDKTLQ